MLDAFSASQLSADELREIWPILSSEERAEGFRMLPREEAVDFFRGLAALGRSVVLRASPEGERRLWMRQLAPDDAADVLQIMEAEERPALLGLLDEATRREVAALLAYAEDEAGGLMNPRFARVRPEMTVEEAIRYLRLQTQTNLATPYYAYALDASQRLLGVVSFRELFLSRGDRLVSDVMRKDVISAPERLDQEAVSQLIAVHNLTAIPVVDDEGRMKGVVTVDDIVDVVQEEATEDIQKMGGMEALEIPYMQTGLLPLIRKRAGWLAILFLGETLTATAMGRFEHEIAQAVVLALFVPLIISSGGNSGSQATTLVIRAMALGEVKLRDWARVIRRELTCGVALGSILALIGAVRITVWERLFGTYGAHWTLVALTVSASLLGVVIFGTLAGSMLPFALRRVGLDPASASAPLVATLVDVTGLVIYFSVASWILHGTLL